MKIKFWASLVVGVSPILLSACGGGGSGSGGGSGGGGGSGAYLFTSASAIRDNGIAILKGSAETAEYSGASGNVSIANRRSGSSTLNVGAKNGETVKIALTAPGSTVNLDSTKGDKLSKNGSINTLRKQNGDDVALFEGGYEYQAFGSWLTGINSNSGTVGSGSYGAATSKNNVPSGNASYTGNSIGIAKLADDNLYVTSSTITADTDFSKVTLESKNTTAVNLSTGGPVLAPTLDFTGEGFVSGATFSSNITGPGLSGNAKGTFYGPNAQEIGGTFRASGSVVEYNGAFGGEK
jgi:hypothetical protein